MAGVYTDNQPDFSFLAPGETKTFRQFWYPIREIGAPDLANLDAAMRLERSPGKAIIHLLVTRELSSAIILLLSEGREIGRWNGRLVPEHPVHIEMAIEGDPQGIEVVLKEMGKDENVILRYAPD